MCTVYSIKGDSTETKQPLTPIWKPNGKKGSKLKQNTSTHMKAKTVNTNQLV